MDYIKNFQESDPEYVEFFGNFLNEVSHEPGIELDEKTRHLAIMATLLGCQGLDLFKEFLKEALDSVTPVEIKEVIYQATAYLGIGRVYPFLKATNNVFEEQGIAFPIEKRSTTNPQNRREKGTDKQVEIFGDAFKNRYQEGPKESVHINRWLASNCFGDYYTREGLNNQQREMITSCYILAQGGCEPQLKGHINGNHLVGNDKKKLIAILSQCMPYIGYPRTLNALRCIQEVLKDE